MMEWGPGLSLIFHSITPIMHPDFRDGRAPGIRKGSSRWEAFFVHVRFGICLSDRADLSLATGDTICSVAGDRKLLISRIGILAVGRPRVVISAAEAFVLILVHSAPKSGPETMS